MLSLELAMVVVPCMEGANCSWFIDTYTSVGISLLTFLCVESSSVG